MISRSIRYLCVPYYLRYPYACDLRYPCMRSQVLSMLYYCTKLVLRWYVQLYYLITSVQLSCTATMVLLINSLLLAGVQVLLGMRFWRHVVEGSVRRMHAQTYLLHQLISGTEARARRKATGQSCQLDYSTVSIYACTSHQSCKLDKAE